MDQKNIDRFWQKVDVRSKTECWDWTGALQGKYYKRPGGGHGSFRWNRKVTSAHRVSWEIHNGPIPDGLQIDHLCMNTRCQNPAHMELGTSLENHRRGGAYTGLYHKSKTHCPNGHEYTPENTTYMSKGKGQNKYRVCRICRRKVERQNRERRMARNADKTVSE